MKKWILWLLTALAVIAGVSFALRPASAPEMRETKVQRVDAAPSTLNGGIAAASAKKNMCSAGVGLAPEHDVGEALVEQRGVCEDIPLTDEEQGWLQTACEEFEVPYALALGLIERETGFQNMAGDDGASIGYMQVQEKWHRDRMDRLGVTDLLEPGGNFRVGCDFLSELYGRYGDWSTALTVYNMGHDPGYITDYAKAVMDNYARWQELIEICD